MLKVLLTIGFDADRDAVERALLRAAAAFVANGAAKRAAIDVRAGDTEQEQLAGVDTEREASAVVALWEPVSVEAALGFPVPAGGRLVGAYRVDEVVQKPYDWSSPGTVTPGVKMVCFVRRRPDLSHEAYSQHWRTRHGPLAVARQPGFWHYVQNHVVERLTNTTPDFDGIGEIHCRSADDALNRSFDSEEGKRLIYEDTQRFMSHEGSTVLLTKEHVVA
jgi:uncharacterized protein (TIGR02118 family)